MEIYPSKLKEIKIPDLNGEVKIINTKFEEKQTQPPKRYSPASIISELEKKTKEELMEMAKEKGVNTSAALKKHDIIMRLLETHTEEQGNLFCSGILEIMPDGY